MYVLSQKLKNFKNRLKVLNKEVFGNIHVLAREYKMKLHDVQN